MEKSQASGSFQTGWTQPKSVPELAEHEVQVWRVATSAMDTRLAGARALLTVAELDRMNRMRAGLPRDEFVLGRGCLRALLGVALKQEPREIVLKVGTHGKPCVGGPDTGMQFNVAHSKGTVLLALCRSAEVGIDLEWLDPRIEALEIAEKNFAPGEHALVQAASEDSRTLQFCRIWAKKEAIVKANGQGLTVGLTGFDVSGALEMPVYLAKDKPRPVADKSSVAYFLTELPVGGDFAAALAVGGKPLPARMFDLKGEFLENLLQKW